MDIVDVSENQGPLDWAAIAHTPGLIGVYVKASEGRSYDDVRAAHNLLGAAAHGLLTGVYHFARPDLNTPEQEAAHFARRLDALPKTQMPPVLDFETKGHTGEDNPVIWARRFNVYIRTHRNVWPLFYSYTAFIYELGATHPIGGGLWLADYGANNGNRHEATPPAPWKHMLMHQYTSRGSVHGYGGHVDLSSVSPAFAQRIGAAAV